MDAATPRRSSLSKACETCKARKTKCDSHRPQCGTCSKRGKPCIYREKGQPGLRPGYGKSVEARLSQLEAMMHRLTDTIHAALPSGPVPTDGSSSGSSTAVAADGIPLPAPGPYGMEGTNGEITCTSDRGDTIQAVVELAPEAIQPEQHHDQVVTSEEAAPVHSPSQTHYGDLEGNAVMQSMQPLQQIEQVRPVDALSVGAISMHNRHLPSDPNIASLCFAPAFTLPAYAFPTLYHDSQPQITKISGSLPPDGIMLELVELFFKCVHPCSRLFHHPTFMSNLFAPERQVLLHAVTVITFRYRDKPDITPELKARYVRSSRESILVSSVDTQSLLSAQALALLAMDSFGCPPWSRTRNIMSLLTTAAEQLALTKCPVEESKQSVVSLVTNDAVVDANGHSHIEEEERRRLFWYIFALDRFVGLSQGSECIIPADAIRQRLPTCDANWSQASLVDVFQPSAQPPIFLVDSTDRWRQFVEVLTLLDRTQKFLLAPVDVSTPAFSHEWQAKFRGLDVEITLWYEYLPRAARDRPTQFDPMWVLTQATFYGLVIRMHSIAAFSATGTACLKGSPIAVQRCHHGVKGMATIFRPLADEELDQLNPLCAFLVWVACRNLIILWTAGAEGVMPVNLNDGNSNSNGNNNDDNNNNNNNVIPPDLDTMLSVLNRMGTHWQCAQHFADLVQLMIDTRHSIGNSGGLRIFTDTRRTIRGVWSAVGHLADENRARKYQVTDWLDIPMDFDHIDMTTPVSN